MTATINGIPIFNALIDDFETGMFCISLVDKPAVESDFLKFDKEVRVPLYCVANEEKRRVLGVVMRADFPIYRYSEEMGEYYITFSADTIRQMAEKYLAEYRQNEVTLHHIAGTTVEGIHLVQYYIKDSAQGIAPQGFDHIEDGSLFAEFQVHDEYLWEQIKQGVFKGFSLEGAFVLEKKQTNSNSNMSKMEKIKEKLAKWFGETFAQVTTDKGVLRWDTDEDLKAGDSVFVLDRNGEAVKPEDGDYKTEDGKVIRVEDGKVVEIVDDRAEVGEEGAEENPEDAEGDRLTKVEEAIATIEKRVADLERRVAEHRHDEEMQAVSNEVAELREALSKTAPKGIEQTFEETAKDDPTNTIANLAKMRAEALKK